MEQWWWTSHCEEEPFLWLHLQWKTSIKGERKGGKPETMWKSALCDRIFKIEKWCRNRLVFKLSLWGRIENRYHGIKRTKEYHWKFTYAMELAIHLKLMLILANVISCYFKVAYFVHIFYFMPGSVYKKIVSHLAKFYICNESILIKFCITWTFLIKMILEVTF